MFSHLFFNRRLALAALIFSIGMLFVALSAATEAAPPTPEKDESKLNLEPVEAELAYQDLSESGLYIVQLHDAPLASYRGGTSGLRATNPAAKGEKKLDVKAPESVAYLQYLDQQRAAAIAEVSQALDRQVDIAYEYKASLNGFAAEMTAAEAATVANLPTIKHIEADTVHELHTDAGPAWIGAPAIWGGGLHDIGFEANLSGLNEVPPVTTSASGLGTFSFDVETGDLDYMIEVSDIMSITVAHIHSGTAGTNGGAIHTLYDGTGEFDPAHPISGTVTLSDTQLAALWSSGLYINIHTTDNPDGELRGQIEQVGTMGEGIIVGVIDTGIDPWNPSFADVGDDGYDHTNPSGAGNYVGVCDPDNTGQNGAVAYDPTFPCNDKLIGVWGYSAADANPRDSNGHGSHVASTAAGNVVFSPTLETPTQLFTITPISGVAPHANIIMYDGCTDGEGCPESSLTAARDQAVMDGVDVINYSVGSFLPSDDPWSDAEGVQWLNIRDAGIFVATSAGNAGPRDKTVGSPGDIPWITSVGANRHNRAFVNSVTLDDGTNPPLTIDGPGLTAGLDTPVEIVFSSAYTASGQISAEDARLCADGVFSGTVDFGGAIVVCERGSYGRVAKGQTVADAGAGGYILAQPDESGGGPSAVVADPHVIPGVHIDYYAYQDLLAYVNNAPDAVLGTISGMISDIDNSHADIMGDFSSRGANRAVPDIIVPSVTAPGRSILAAYQQGEGGDGDFTFNVIGGTSMSSPHVAGSGALIMARHPDWTPAEIQSALMTTARDSILNDDGITPATPFAQGAGEVDLTQAPLAGLVLDVTTQEFEAANPAEGGDPKALNLASLGNSQCFASCSWTRTVRSTLGVTQTWNATIMADSGVTLTATVEPATFELAPGATQELTITVDVSELPAEEWAFAKLMLTPSSVVRSGVGGEEVPEAHLPIAVRPLISILPSQIEVDTRRNAGSQLIEGIQAIEISELTINTSLSQGTLTHETLEQDSDNSTPYDDLTDGVFFITTTVPANAVSLIAETTESSATDLDLFVGLDTNGDGMPEASEELCFTFTGGCELVAPAEGTYWILVQNWVASASPPDVVTLVSAVVLNSDNNHISVAAPDSVPSGEAFDMRLFWDIPEMMAGERWYGYVSLGTDGANAGNIGTIPVYLNRHEDDVTKEVSHALVEAGDSVTYTITIQPNVTAEDITYSLTDTIPAGMTYVADSATASEGTASVTGDILTWTGVPPTILTLVESNLTGYISLAALGIPPALCPTDCDDGGHLITGLDITYQGQHYTQAIWSVNGTLELGTASGVTSGGLNQELPNPATPNNLLAPWWADLDLSAGGNWYFVKGTLGFNTYAVFEWEDVPLFGDATSTATFQIWLLDGSDQIWFTYDEITGDTSTATVGVENQDGTLGHSYYYNGTGTLPSSANDLLVTQRKDPVVITFQAIADEDAPDEVTNTVEHNTDNPGSRVESASASTTVISYGVLVSPDLAATGDADTTVDYSLSVTNTGNTTDTFELTVDSNWTTILSESSVTLPAGESTTLMASVEIPSDAINGESDTATVTATSQSSGGVSALVTLSTTATAVTSISLATFDQEVKLAWLPIVLLALLLALIASYRIVLLQRGRIQ